MHPHKESQIDVVTQVSENLPRQVAKVGMEAAWFMQRSEELRERYLAEMEERCEQSEYPAYEARALLTTWFAELRAECETRMDRLEAELASLARQRRAI